MYRLYYHACFDGSWSLDDVEALEQMLQGPGRASRERRRFRGELMAENLWDLAELFYELRHEVSANYQVDLEDVQIFDGEERWK